MYLLYRWRDFADDDGVEVKRWTGEQLASDEMAVRFAEAFTSYSWGQGMGIVGLGDMVGQAPHSGQRVHAPNDY
ncbi:MAG: hypothetical protein ACREC0_13345 [Methylocella sp.]